MSIVHNKYLKIIVQLMVVASFLGIAIPSYPAAGSTIYVDDDNISGPWEGTQSNPFQTISDGIDAAENGDMIYVYSGTYSENLVIAKNISITGENRDTTIVQPNADGHVIYATGGIGTPIEVHIQGITVKNADGSGYDNIAYSYVQNGDIINTRLTDCKQGDGIQLDHSSMIIIRDNIILNNQYIGISMTLSSNNLLYNNQIEGNQKGIHLYVSNLNNIYENTLSENTQYGIYIAGSSSNTLYKNDFTNNGQNAYDPLTNNWDYNDQGNYWDDYNNYDDDENGIGDVSYQIPGGSNIDAYPLGYFLEHEPPGGGNQAPTAYQPTITPTTAPLGTTITCSGGGFDPDGIITGFVWRSSLDGPLSSQQTFEISTLSLGNHTLYFKVRDNDGAWSTEKMATVTITAQLLNKPTAIIDSITPNPAELGSTISFSGQGITQDGEIVEYTWISSIDGKLSDKATFETNSLSQGLHTIYFRVKNDENNWSDTVTKIITVTETSVPPNGNQTPNADAGGPYLGTINQMVVFDASESTDADGAIISYFWEFGDGGSGSGVSSQHSYGQIGNYSVSVTVTDDSGEQSSAVTYVIITETQNENPGGESFLDPEALLKSIPLPVMIAVPVIMVVCAIAIFFWKIR